MKFWGAEVKPGEPLMVTPEDNTIHISQASLDCKGKMGETVVLSVNVDGTTLVIGTLSRDKFPQISLDLFFEKNFELSHNCTKASVHFMGYKSPNIDQDEEGDDYSGSDEEVPAAPNIDQDEEGDDNSGSDEEEEVPAAPVAANRNAGAAASTVVKADSKPKAKPEEVKPESDDDSDDKDDESHDDDSVKGMEVDEDDSTDQRTESLFDHNWPSSSEEPEGEEFVHPYVLCASNLIPNITVADIKNFFATIAEPNVRLEKLKDDMGAVIVFSCLEETQAAVRLRGNDLLGRPVYLARYPNGVRTVCVTGFDPQQPRDKLIKQMGQKLVSFGEVYSSFIPRSPSTGSYLGFCYIYLTNTIHDGDDPKFKSLLKKVDRTMGGFEINFSHVHLKAWVNNAITEGNHHLVVEKIEALKNAIEDQRAKGVEETDQDVTFSWRNTAGLFFDYEQGGSECWAVVLSRGQLAARKIADPDQSSSEPSVKTILNGVDSRYHLSGRGIDKIQNARPFMMQHVKDMTLHHKPKSMKLEDFESFQTDAIHLAKKVPVAVVINCIPSFQSWKGQGIYCPSVIEVCRMFMEKDPGHGLLLCGVGIERGVKFLELQESLGEGWGDGGFIKIAYHNYMIKQVIEFKV